ncbi:Rap1a/Tai family immunity protein [Pseudooceanicola sp. HF7]|uniref:Rap1a/Tai family immunity protein n=1 Tax=Pseudooceanicola sp. HF7 TaxID=2721560 RepID=UPI00142FB19F|nr:Rap1a/Tai family immunity protein [Pseudooceanicola sp. HF7]NIZ11556.1 hypothetical protein [Pseudooceanicola sp. HF7]
MKRMAFAPMALLLSAAAPAQAQQFPGQQFLDLCTSADAGSRGFCIGYLIGIIEGSGLGVSRALSVEEDSTPEAPAIQRRIPATLGYCLPTGTDINTLPGVVIDFAAGKPEAARLPAAALVSDALISKYPCN